MYQAENEETAPNVRNARPDEVTRPRDGDLTGHTLLERFRVISVLGQGAMGCVYLAEDLQVHRQVALKVLRREWVGQPEVRKRLENECRIMARLGPHSHIVTLYDRFEHEGDVVLVMEFVPGETLASVLERMIAMNTAQEAARKTTPVLAGVSIITLQGTEPLRVAMQCLQALDFAHSRGILHRDIKPSNIMLARDHNGYLVAKVMDFGIGKALTGEEDTAELANLTRAGGPGPGTPAYMAPEQIEPYKFGELGPHTDLYALGATLYEMLAMRPPFLGTYTELLLAHTSTPPPDPQNFNRAISPPLKRVLLRALEKDPHRRYRAATEFQADLHAASGSGGTMLLQPGYAGMPSAAPPRTRHGARQFVLPLLLLVGLAIAGGSGYVRWSQQPGGKLETDDAKFPGTAKVEEESIEATQAEVVEIPMPLEVGGSEADDSAGPLVETRADPTLPDEEMTAPAPAPAVSTPVLPAEILVGPPPVLDGPATPAGGQAAPPEPPSGPTLANQQKQATPTPVPDFSTQEAAVSEARKGAVKRYQAVGRGDDLPTSSNTNYGRGLAALEKAREEVARGNLSVATAKYFEAETCFRDAAPLAPKTRKMSPNSSPSPQPQPKAQDPVINEPVWSPGGSKGAADDIN